MDTRLENQHRERLRASAVSTATVDDASAALGETRQQFIEAFDSQCDAIAALADETVANPSSSEHAIKLLHRMAGLGGTIGFPRVSGRAGALEEALRASPGIRIELRDGVATLRSAFAQDAAEPSPDWASPRPQGSSMTVLVVEDDVVQRTVISAQLRRAGHSPVAVTCGEEALAAARGARPDVILLDVELPGINGYAVCRLLKADPALAGIPVAFLSAHGNLDDRLTGLSFGADDFLTKPIDSRELAMRLQLLSKREQRVDDHAARGVLTYEAFRDLAGEEIRRDRSALALIRTPADMASDVAAFTRDEIRRRDLCGQYDRSHVVALLPDMGGASARDRIASIVEKCRANGMSGVYAGIAASPVAAARTLEQLLEEADKALAIARYEELTAALLPNEPREERPAQSVAPMVVVGDDDPDVVRIVDAHLASGGYRRVLTFDGSRTLEEVRAQRPDVLVLDLMMPRMTGFDVLAGLRDMGASRPRVLVLSARGREEDIVRAFGLGADDFMVKPFNPQELLARIARLVKSADRA
jgi:DNA-binding response OmpR family regulator